MNSFWNVRIFLFSLLVIITGGYFTIPILPFITPGYYIGNVSWNQNTLLCRKNGKSLLTILLKMKCTAHKIIVNTRTKSETLIPSISWWCQFDHLKKLIMLLIFEHWRTGWIMFLKYIFQIFLFHHPKYKAKQKPR